MSEQRTSKASELAEDLVRRPLPESEKPNVPELRLRTDAPAMEIDQTVPVTDTLAQLRSEGIDTLALREPGGDATAVVMSTKRYLELVGKELASGKLSVTLNNDIAPAESAFAASHVEQVDPHETWTP